MGEKECSCWKPRVINVRRCSYLEYEDEGKWRIIWYNGSGKRFTHVIAERTWHPNTKKEIEKQARRAIAQGVDTWSRWILWMRDEIEVKEFNWRNPSAIDKHIVTSDITQDEG